jgi:hypothetical protein
MATFRVEEDDPEELAAELESFVKLEKKGGLIDFFAHDSIVKGFAFKS